VQSFLPFQVKVTFPDGVSPDEVTVTDSFTKWRTRIVFGLAARTYLWTPAYVASPE
jgi:hypothetical protein